MVVPGWGGGPAIPHIAGLPTPIAPAGMKGGASAARPELAPSAAVGVAPPGTVTALVTVFCKAAQVVVAIVPGFEEETMREALAGGTPPAREP